MTNEIMKLVDAYAEASFDQGMNRKAAYPEKERAELVAALEQQAAEIERLTDSPFSEEAFDILRGENRMLRAKLDAATKVPLTEEQRALLCKAHLWMHGTRFEDAYNHGFLDAEAAHNIKGTTP